MLSNHHGDHQGDKIVHTSLNLPEGYTHNSVIDNHAFVSMMHPEGGHADYAPTTDYQDNHQGVMNNVHKVLGQYAGGKIPPKMDTGASPKPIQGFGGGAPGASPTPAQEAGPVPNAGWDGKTFKPGYDKQGVLPAQMMYLDKMLNKAMRAKPRSYSKGWGGKRHVNR